RRELEALCHQRQPLWSFVRLVASEGVQFLGYRGGDAFEGFRVIRLDAVQFTHQLAHVRHLRPLLQPRTASWVGSLRAGLRTNRARTFYVVRLCARWRAWGVNVEPHGYLPVLPRKLRKV